MAADGREDKPPTFTVTIRGVDAATATYLLESYDMATAAKETGPGKAYAEDN